MLTIFALPKPFKGHIGVIQRNAISQWARLRPKPEILLFGNEQGTAEIANELGLRHISGVERNQHGTPLLSDLFEKAQTLASYDTLCYVNSDIVLLGDFMSAVKLVSFWRDRFLMVGRRRDVELDEPPIYQSPDQEVRLRALVMRQSRPITPWAIDYFVFPRRLLSSFPPFPIGRPYWDNWFLWKVRDSRAALVDASAAVLAVHQNHDYSHHPQGKFGVYHGAEERQNSEFVGNHVYNIEDANYKLTVDGVRYNVWHFFAVRHRAWRTIRAHYWKFLKLTGPLRHPLGLRQEKIVNALGKARLFLSR